MRSFEIFDLHDYYDFNYAIESRADTIVEKVLSGQYRAESPLVYRLEKSFGVCRHVMVPTPSDALVFQLLTDSLYKSVIKKQPSEGAFYARDRHTMRLPHEHQEARSYPWFILWPKFQKDIWQFSRSHHYLVTTDLSNYYDTIGLRELRHVISSIAKSKEVHLDLLFSLIEDLSWKPDYLPTSQKGLPIIDIEAPRLLAHALLFEVDYVLKRRTKNNFVRWMDDINFGVSDKREAFVILGEINDVLKSRGLALNLGKTEIMTAQQAQFHFLFRENVKLSRIQARARKLKTLRARKRLAGRLQVELERHIRGCKARNKDKVTKRYLSILGILRMPVALSQVKRLYINHPPLRTSVLKYLAKLSFSKRVANTLVELWDGTQFYDDVTRFSFVQAVVEWQVPCNNMGLAFLTKIELRLKSFSTAFDWLCYLVFLAKYGESHKILNAVQIGRTFGSKEPFFARQRIAVLSRGLAVNASVVLRAWRTERLSGYSDSASVANSLLQFAGGNFPHKTHRLYTYLFPKKPQNPYPLPKFLLLCTLAYGDTRSRQTVRRGEVDSHVSDPWYRHWLKQINRYWVS
jgi:hypothetical protein